MMFCFKADHYKSYHIKSFKAEIDQNLPKKGDSFGDIGLYTRDGDPLGLITHKVASSVLEGYKYSPLSEKTARYYRTGEILGFQINSNRNKFRGNILEFSVKDDNFKVFNVFTWPESATKKLVGDIRIAGSYGGVTTDLTTKEVRAFYCKDVVSSDFSCEPEADDELVYKNSAFKSTILAVEVYGTPNPEKEAFRSIFAVIGLESETVVVRFSHKKKWITPLTIPEFIATSDNITYNISDNKFKIFTLKGNELNSYSWKMDATDTPKVEPYLITLPSRDKCSYRLQSDGENVSIVLNCPDTIGVFGENIFVSTIVESEYIKKEYTGFIPIVTLSDLTTKPDELSICLTGKENIVFAHQGPSKQLLESHATNVNSAMTIKMSELYTAKGLPDSASLKCLDAGKGFILTHQSGNNYGYWAFFGDKHYDALNRVHSFNLMEGELDGYKVESMAGNTHGYTVILSKGNQRRF